MGEVRFKDVADRWLATKAHLRRSTRSLYDWLLVKHILPTFADRPIGTITTLDLQMWISDRHANSRLGPNSVAKAYKIVRSVMESAVDAGLILRSPCRVKGAATEHLPEMRAATAEEVASLAQATGPRWQALILLAAYSGLRWGELAGLRRRDVDALHRTVRVEHQLAEGTATCPSRPRRRPPGCGPLPSRSSSSTSWPTTSPAGALPARMGWSSSCPKAPPCAGRTSGSVSGSPPAGRPA